MRRIEGSSKDILVEREPKDDEMGVGYFIPKDEFSIFDYKVKGKWPFTIPHKGIAMQYIINKSYMLAKDAGIDTCFIEPTSNGSKVHLVRVPGRELPLDYSKVEVGTRNRMIDLEFIFNYYLHPRSSLLKDIVRGKKDYRMYGFKEMPRGGELIPISEHNPPVSYTTKYDKSGDIPLDAADAKERSRLTDEQWIDAHELISRCTSIINGYAKSKRLIRFDGKYEVFVDPEGNVGLADTFGNPEEDRFMLEVRDINIPYRFLDFYARRWSLKQDKVKEVRDEIESRYEKDGKVLVDTSKQFIRNWYIDNGWKAMYDSGVASTPPMMHIDVISAYSDLMLSFAALWSDRISEIVNITGVLVRPIEEVAGELYVLESLNKRGLIPVT